MYEPGSSLRSGSGSRFTRLRELLDGGSGSSLTLPHDQGPQRAPDAVDEDFDVGAFVGALIGAVAAVLQALNGRRTNRPCDRQVLG